MVEHICLWTILVILSAKTWGHCWAIDGLKERDDARTRREQYRQPPAFDPTTDARLDHFRQEFPDHA